LIGDRSIQEKDFGTIQKDRQPEMSSWADSLLRARNNVTFGIVAANNHYAGFGPATVNLFRKTLGLPELAFTDKKQVSLTDFSS
jgi:hypothetical protein